MELDVQESFKLKTGVKGEEWKNMQFGWSSQISLLRKRIGQKAMEISGKQRRPVSINEAQIK